jgi:hypothetical protein
MFSALKDGMLTPLKSARHRFVRVSYKAVPEVCAYQEQNHGKLNAESVEFCSASHRRLVSAFCMSPFSKGMQKHEKPASNWRKFGTKIVNP